MRGGLGGRLGSGSVRSTTAAAVREQNRCQVGPTILFECPAQIPRSFLRSFSLWARHPAETSAERNVRLGAAELDRRSRRPDSTPEQASEAGSCLSGEG